MCGIAGIAASASLPDLAERVAAMSARVAHRGPDDHGIYLDPQRRVGLGHRRLSIIDLSARGHQPMSDERGELWLVFNGEIYNFQPLRAELARRGHRFRSASDSEVVLHAWRQWGRDCLHRLNGMFALALYDAAARTLFLARDRLGEKPLLWTHSHGALLFASGAKALLAGRPGGWTLDVKGLDEYLAFGHTLGERSVFAGIRRLLPGHWLTYELDGGALRTGAYWQPPVPTQAPRSTGREELLSELEALAEDSVRLRLTSDVPVGVLLSGGVDSSLVAALAARCSPRRLQTFTVTFPGGGAYDESAPARVVARHLGSEHHELPMPSPDLEALRRLAHHLDEPLADPSVLPTFLVAELTRQHVKAALGGDGGDELFGGYAWYVAGEAFARRGVEVPRPLRAAAAAAAGLLPPGVPGRNFLRARRAGLSEFAVTRGVAFGAAQRRTLLAPLRPAADDAGADTPEDRKRALWPEGGDPVLQMSLLDLRSWLPDDILVKLDAASMAVALELRVPLLDHRLVEFALQRVPSHLKVDRGGSRRLERELARRLLPRELDLERKQGFVFPVHRWMADGWGDATLEALAQPSVARWIDPAPARALLAGQRRGRTNGVRLFTLLVLALWLDGLEPGAGS